MDAPLTQEGLPTNQLIDKILVGTCLAATLAFAGAQWRALDIGWSLRDLFQLLAVAGLAALTWARQKIEARYKAWCLILLLTLASMPGVYTLGMFAGTIYVFPTVAVIVAVIFSLRATMFYILLSLVICILTAVRFSSDNLQLADSIAHLGGNGFHWTVYILCMGLFFTVSTLTIHRYRHAVKTLIGRIQDQHDQLERNNAALSRALDDVKKLSGLLPICSYCKKVRDDKGYWRQLEAYIEANSEAAFSHSICEACAKKFFPDMAIYDEDG